MSVGQPSGDQTGDRNPLQINQFGNRQSIMDSEHIQSNMETR